MYPLNISVIVSHHKVGSYKEVK